MNNIFKLMMSSSLKACVDIFNQCIVLRKCQGEDLIRGSINIMNSLGMGMEHGLDIQRSLLQRNQFIIYLIRSHTSQMIRLGSLLLLQILAILSYSQILAIDYGTQFIKAALVHTGAGKTFSIVENSKSQRKFINAMGIYNEERFYEADTLTKRSRGPSNCFIFSRLLIDLHQSPSQLERVKKEFILQYLKNPESDQLMAEFVLEGMPQDANTFTLLETITMMIKYVKFQAQKHAKTAIKDVVLTVPSHWNLKQRKFLVEAATLADLYVLTLIHENTAAALNYALSQRATNQTQRVLFYNLGANSLQMSLAEFREVKTDKTKSIESVFILGDYGQSYVGGLSLDYLIADFFTKKFEEKYKKELNERGKIRLLAEAQKIKKVLSANKEATMYVEGLMYGIDFTATISRTEFERLADGLLQKLVEPIRRFIFDHDLKPSELTAVELIGGGSRVPRLQALIGEAIDNSSLVGSHINGDEAMVFGAAFYGANSSKKFKVKGMNLYDGFNFDIRIVLRNSEKGISQDDERYYFKNATLFKKKNRFGLTKEVTFKCKQNLMVDLYKQDESGVELLTSYLIDSIQSVNQSNFKISLVFEIHPVQVVKLQSVKYLYSKDIVQSYTEKVKKAVPKSKTTEDEEEESSDKKSQDEEQEAQEEKEQKEEKEEEGSKGEEKIEGNQTKTEKKKKKKEKIEYETVERTRNVTKKFQDDLEFRQTFIAHDDQDQEVMRKTKRMLSFFESKEETKKKLAESKNKLEALIYESRDRLDQQQFMEYAQQQEKERIKQLSSEKSAWYEDATSTDPEDYLKEFKSLNEPLEKIKKRMTEHRESQKVYQRALEIIEDYSNQSKKLRKIKGWITEEEVEELTGFIAQTEKKIKSIYSELKETPVNEDSIFKNKDMIKETDVVKDKFFALKGKTKPKGWKDEKEEGKEKEKKQEKKEQEQVREDEL